MNQTNRTHKTTHPPLAIFTRDIALTMVTLAKDLSMKEHVFLSDEWDVLTPGEQALVERYAKAQGVQLRIHPIRA